ncbi:MAG: amidohydrolase family protein, partial [Methanobrevibacter sp.]|nr:amidohydrolase family protein [Methanobrevibacter sp.]
SLTICPRSNGALNVGINPLKEILDEGEKPLIGTDNIMLNSPNMFRELEFTLKIMKAYSRSYISPKDILKLATTNACHEDVNIPGLDKSYIEVGQKEELFIANCKSNNPILSLINRTEIDDIVYISK